MVAYTHEHTHLTSPDPDKTVAFYTEVMDAKVTGRLEVLGRSLINIELGGLPVRISSSTVADDAKKGPPFGIHHLALEVNDIDEAVADLKAKGVEIIVGPSQARPGLRYAFIKCPDDVVFEIVETKES